MIPESGAKNEVRHLDAGFLVLDRKMIRTIKSCFSQHCVLDYLCVYVYLLHCVRFKWELPSLYRGWIFLLENVFRLHAQLYGKIFHFLTLAFPVQISVPHFFLWWHSPFCPCASHHVAGDGWAEAISPTDPPAPALFRQHLLPLYFLFLSTSDLALLLICHLAATLHSIPSPGGCGQGRARNGTCLGWQTNFQEATAQKLRGWYSPKSRWGNTFLCAPSLNPTHLDCHPDKDVQL